MEHQYLVVAALILVAVELSGLAARRLGQPSVLGKLLSGVILGPAVLNWVQPGPWIAEAAQVGVILLMFIAGLETDLGQFRRSVGGAFLVATVGVIVPFIGGWGLAESEGYHGIPAVFTGVLLVATSVSISVQTLRELGRLTSREGATILGAAVIDDVLGLIVLSAVLGLASGGGANLASDLPIMLLKIAAFLAAAFGAGRYLLPPLIRAIAKVETGAARTAMAIAAALAFGYVAEAFGLAAIVGAYVLGLALGSAGLSRSLLPETEAVTFSFFAPFFFVNVGLAANFAGVGGRFWLFAVALCAVAVATKVIGCGVGARMGGFSRKSSLVIGAGMVARGEVGLIVASIGLEQKLIPQELYSGMIAVTLITTLVTPPLLKWALGRAGGHKEQEAR